MYFLKSFHVFLVASYVQTKGDYCFCFWPYFEKKKKKGCFYLVRFHAESLRKILAVETARRGGTHRVLSLGAHQPGLQHIQGLAQESGTATLRRNSTVTSRQRKSGSWWPREADYLRR